MAERDKRRGAPRRPPSPAGASERREHLTSLDALRRRVPEIVQLINAEPALALRAAANPILALEELGYSLDEALAREVAMRVRFDEPTVAKLQALTKRIHKLAGEPFDLESPEETGRVLFETLGLPRVDLVQRVVIAEGRLAEGQTREYEKRRAAPPDSASIPRRQVGGVAPLDPLTALEGAHPVIAPLLEYRAIEASMPPLAPRELYDRIAHGEMKGPRITIRARLRRGMERPDA
jgi:hypothetical protein